MSDFSDISICKHGQRYCPDDAQIGCSRCEAEQEAAQEEEAEECQECEDDFVEKLEGTK